MTRSAYAQKKLEEYRALPAKEVPLPPVRKQCRVCRTWFLPKNAVHKYCCRQCCVAATQMRALQRARFNTGSTHGND